MADRTGSLGGVRRQDYLPFGEELFAGMGGRATQQGYVGNDVRQGFIGYEHDEETGLDFAEARYFASSQGRFVSTDPLIASARRQTPQSWNRYSHAINNPLKYVDPTGEGWVLRRNGDIFWDKDVNTQKEVSKKYPGAQLFNGQVGIATKGGHLNLMPGHMYRFNANGKVDALGPYTPPPTPQARISHEYGDRLAWELLKLNFKAQLAGLTGGTSLLGLGLGAAGIAADVLAEEDAPDPQTVTMAATTAGGAFTEPTLPPNTIAEERGVTINHNYRGDEHGPAHAHVKGGGKDTRIGPLGHPLKGDPPLSPQQRAVVQRHQKQIRRTLNKIGRWLRYVQRARGR
jgi:RHS repeat-associated protein